MTKAIDWFQRALTLDPNYAPAYSGLADCYYMASGRFYLPNEAMPKARSAALHAIQLDETLGEAHATLALVRSVYEYDRAEAEKEFKRAIELKPGDAQSRVWYGSHLVAGGRFDEAVAEVERAQKLDPVSPGLNGYIGAILYFAHRYDQIVQRMQPIAEMYPDFVEPRWWDGDGLRAEGRMGEGHCKRGVVLQEIGRSDGRQHRWLRPTRTYVCCVRTGRQKRGPCSGSCWNCPSNVTSPHIRLPFSTLV